VAIFLPPFAVSLPTRILLMIIRRISACAALAALLLAVPTGAEPPVPEKSAAPASVQFARDVLPILSANCFTCHGPDEKGRKAGLRLDIAGEAVKPLKTGSRAIVPGKPQESELVARIFSSDRNRMPPPKSNLNLKESEKQLLRRWIEQGAEYQQHWAFVAPKRPVVPTPPASPPSQGEGKQIPSPPSQGGDKGGWVKNPIDAFILARLRAEGLKPSPEADRWTLARRVAIDLTGLPPSIEAVERFIKDQSPNAYEKFVDEMLASPGYGERWAAVWLDLARYADSNGYANDNPRTIWRFRDWVIEAINANIPYDRFTIEQLAGDLLIAEPGASAPGGRSPSAVKQLLATAFHRNTLTNDEGGTNDEEFRVAAVVDRVNTTMQVWMGLTMGCAQCHDHKYDPFSQEEYYRLFAIFNQTEDADRGDNSPLLTEFTPEMEKQRKQLQEEIARLEKVVAEQKATPPAPADVPLPKRKGDLPTRYVRVELLGKGVYLHLAEVQVFVGDDNVARKGKASQVSTDFEGPAHLAIDGNTDGEYFTGKSVSHTGMADNPWWEVDLGKAVTIDRIAVWNRTDGGTGDRLNSWRIIALDEKRQPVWVKSYNQPPRPSVAVAVPRTAETLDAAAKNELAKYVKGDIAVKATPEQKQLDALKKQLSAIKGITTPIMKELSPQQQRKTHILVRGDFLVKDKEVTAGVPAIFQASGGRQPPEMVSNRLDLARWLVSPDNPLTARVTVNRYWEQIFGRGLVETPEDWGIRGKLPTHPELLDWLAVHFSQADAPGEAGLGWDVKKLLRLIVTSATYRQSSRVTPALLERDPDNRLYARGPRFRSSAEVIRDQSLFVSGLLSPKLGGPPARPPRPKLKLNAAFGGNTDWEASPGDDRYRRGLYTEWRRTTPYPSMVTFDAPGRSVCTVNRPRTNTPLQALVTLNDPCFVEAAQALARRILKEGGTTVESRVQYAFRLCLTRPPQEQETQRLVTLYQQARERYSQNPKEAQAMATEPLGPLPAGVDLTDAAAWTVVANVLLNLDEMFLKR
jgi:mono/diheme cytochrome c family protein